MGKQMKYPMPLNLEMMMVLVPLIPSIILQALLEWLIQYVREMLWLIIFDSLMEA